MQVDAPKMIKTVESMLRVFSTSRTKTVVLTFATEEMLVALALGTRAATGTGAATGTPVDTLLVVTFRAATTGDITLGGTPETTLVDTTQVETTPVATTPETTVMVAM